jgi:23S rRNA-/tRNA-specific pseudouridylate synthase
MAPAHGRIDVRLKTISTVMRHFAAPHPGGKEAVTEFKRLAVVQQNALVGDGMAGKEKAEGYCDSSSSSSVSYSLLLVTPITGRMHQIRAHLSHIGHPLDGDGRYALKLKLCTAA